MKRILSLALALCLCLTLFGCSSAQTESSQASSESGVSSQEESSSEVSQPESQPSSASESAAEEPADLGTAVVAALKGPTAMGMVKMMSDDAASDSPLYDFSILRLR